MDKYPLHTNHFSPTKTSPNGAETTSTLNKATDLRLVRRSFVPQPALLAQRVRKYL